MFTPFPPPLWWRFLLSILNREGIVQSPPHTGLSLLLHGGRLFCEDKGSACNGCLLSCLPSLGLPGYCRASRNDSWVWQMSGTAGCVLDYPKSLDSTVIHHCPNYLGIDCGTLCGSPVMANYPRYLWYPLDNGFVKKGKKTIRRWGKKNTKKSNILFCAKNIDFAVVQRIYMYIYIWHHAVYANEIQDHNSRSWDFSWNA